jgi:hypothetical protein
VQPDVILQLPFLAKRSYLHGTTLFEALAPLVPADARTSFSISRRIESDRIQLLRRSTLDKPMMDESARLAWRTVDAGGIIGVSSLPPSREVKRIAYDEPLVADHVTVEGKSAVLSVGSPFSLVATLIPIFKCLLEPVKTPGPGQWMFTRLDLERRPGQFTPLRLTLENVLAGSLARSAVESCGQHIGSLYFSWVRASAP